MPKHKKQTNTCVEKAYVKESICRCRKDVNQLLITKVCTKQINISQI